MDDGSRDRVPWVCRSSACCSTVLLPMPSAKRAGRSPRWLGAPCLDCGELGRLEQGLGGPGEVAAVGGLQFVVGLDGHPAGEAEQRLVVGFPRSQAAQRRLQRRVEGKPPIATPS